MIEQSILIKLSSPGLADSTTSRLRQEYQACQKLFEAQPALVQQYLGIQAAGLVEAVIQDLPQAHFVLPEQVAFTPNLAGTPKTEVVPPARRAQAIGGWLRRWHHLALTSALCQRLSELEESNEPAVSVCAMLFRYSIAVHMIYRQLPAGRSVVYITPEDDDIPNQPVDEGFEHASATAGSMDASARGMQTDDGYGESSVPYVEAARRFFLPQWVSFDNQGQLLVNSINEAEAHIASMQHYLAILNSAISIAPYMIADEMCQQKRYGILGQLVNQGRALANYQAQEIIQTIQLWVAEQRLNRGLWLSLPYFNDQTLSIENCSIEVIPAGRIMFVPAFVVLAVQRQGAKVAQDTHFSRSTRRHLLSQLSQLEQAFLR